MSCFPVEKRKRRKDQEEIGWIRKSGKTQAVLIRIFKQKLLGRSQRLLR